jgi:peptidoglycan/LPS O-acetylase OafA/YrhL
MKSIYKIAVYLLILLGIIHSSTTPVWFETFDWKAMYFLSGGLMMIFAGFLNIIYWRNSDKDKVIGILCRLANIIICIFTAVYYPFDPSPQIYVAIVLVLTVTAGSFRDPVKRSEK